MITPPSMNSEQPGGFADNNLGALLSQTGKPAEAEAEDRRAVSLLQKLVEDNPTVTRFRNWPRSATTNSENC